MRIGIEAQRIFRTKKHGMDMVALQLIKVLPEVAPEHEYVVFARPGEDSRVLDDISGLKVVTVGGLTYADWEQLWLPLAIAKHKIDVMHYTSNTASLFCPVPFVLTLHDVIFLENGTQSKLWYQRLGAIYRRWNVPAIVRKASKVITVSSFESVRILNHFPELQGNVRVIYNAASNTFFSSPDNVDPKVQNLPETFLLFLGNTDPKKNTTNVIRAYARYRQNYKGGLPLVIGDFPRQLVEKILIEEGNGYLLEDIVSLGYLSQNTLSYLYRRATAFLYPSLRESFGIPIVEAMASRCPVITSNVTSMPEIAEGAALEVNPENVNEIARAMHRMETDGSLRERLALAGSERALDFDWRSSAREYVRIYEEISLSKILNKLFVQNL